MGTSCCWLPGWEPCCGEWGVVGGVGGTEDKGILGVWGFRGTLGEEGGKGICGVMEGSEIIGVPRG